MRSWAEADIPDQSGRTAVITGANSGLGLASATALARKGARVLLACRSGERGEQALRHLAAVAHTAPKLIRLDLASLESVRKAAAEIRDTTGDALDLLMNNAGVMATRYRRSSDGFELQFGTNHLGHAALTWLLMPALRGGSAARIVTLSSLAARGGRIDFADPNFEHHRYHAVSAYCQAKLANQVFALELDRRLRDAGLDIVSAAAHPGYTATGLNRAMARSYPGPLGNLLAGASRLGDLLFAQNVRTGMLPQLYAATAPGVNGGDYIGPDRFGGTRGHPTVIQPVRPALDRRNGTALWELTAKLTGVIPAPA